MRLQAVLSGTLNYIVNEMSDSKPRREMESKQKGYSEPDPRIDLSGTDVVRKLLFCP